MPRKLAVFVTLLAFGAVSRTASAQVLHPVLFASASPNSIAELHGIVRDDGGKALDSIGDLYVLGAPILGRFESELGGHAINNQLVRALAARPEAWRIRTFADEIAVAV